MCYFVVQKSRHIFSKPQLDSCQNLYSTCAVETKVVDILDKTLDLIAFVKTIHCSGEILLRALSPPWMAGPPMGMLGARVHRQRGHRAHGHPRVQARRWADVQLPRQRRREV